MSTSNPSSSNLPTVFPGNGPYGGKLLNEIPERALGVCLQVIDQRWLPLRKAIVAELRARGGNVGTDADPAEVDGSPVDSQAAPLPLPDPSPARSSPPADYPGRVPKEYSPAMTFGEHHGERIADLTTRQLLDHHRTLRDVELLEFGELAQAVRAISAELDLRGDKLEREIADGESGDYTDGPSSPRAADGEACEICGACPAVAEVGEAGGPQVRLCGGCAEEDRELRGKFS